MPKATQAVIPFCSLLLAALMASAGAAHAQPAPAPYPQPQSGQAPAPQQPPPGYPAPAPQYPQQPPQYPQQPPQYPQQPPQYPQQPPQYPAPAPAPPPAPPPPSPPPYQIPEEDLPVAGSGLYPGQNRYYSLPPEQTPSLDRRGFAFQVGVGMGGIFDEDDGRFGVGYQLAAGGVLNRHFAFLFDYSTLTFAQPGNLPRATHAIFGGVAQLFLGDIVWVKAGAGLGNLGLDNEWGFNLIEATERAFAGIFGFGVEVYQIQPDFALDVQLRVAGASYRDAGVLINGLVMVGFNGY